MLHWHCMYRTTSESDSHQRTKKFPTTCRTESFITVFTTVPSDPCPESHESSPSLDSSLLRYISVLRFLAGDRGSTVVKVLCYKSEGRWFDSRWCLWNCPCGDRGITVVKVLCFFDSRWYHWNFSLT